MKKRIILNIIYAVIAVGWLFTLESFYYKGVKEPPLRLAQIPQETIDFFNNLVETGSDIAGNIDGSANIDIFIDSNNAGEREPGLGLEKIQDSNFIIYYSKQNEQEKEKAYLALKYSNEAIPELSLLFGEYIYAKDIKGKRLPVYLAQDVNSFRRIFAALVPGKKASETAWGYFISSVTLYGNLPCAILIHPEPWKQNLARMVLWHEIAHYVYFQLKKNPHNEKLWVIEGIADYFADDKSNFKRINPDYLDSFSLAGDVKNYGDSYWIGYTVFKYMQDGYAVQTVRNFLLNNYKNPSTESIPEVTGKPLNEFEQKWKEYTYQRRN